MGLTQGKYQTISIGEMRSSAQFMNNTPTQNASGGHMDSYTAFYTCRCRFRQKSGNRRLQTGEIVNVRRFELVCRFTDSLLGQITAATRVVVTVGVLSSNYAIDTYELVDEINHWFSFTLNKIDA